MKKYIATFYSHYGAVCYKRNCEGLGLEAEIMPVPRNLSSSCGTCVRFESENLSFPEFTEELEQIVEIFEQGYRTVYCADD